MIITRTPFRISFCGGGSDLPSFYKKHGGCTIGTTINKYVYIAIHPSFDPKSTILKYSKTETVNNLSQIEHKYFKRVLTDFNLSGVDISNMADVPAGTGLGSSSAFMVGLLQTIYSYRGKFVSKSRLAEEACDYEINRLGEPIGKQDQYASAYGGLNFYSFNKDGSVFVDPILMSNEAKHKLDNNLLMFFTGGVRSASEILSEQQQNVTAGEKERNQLKMCDLARDFKAALENNRVDTVGEILDEGWRLKRTLAKSITNPVIDESYELALKNGALGGKLLGAGGGGFLLFYVPEKAQSKVRASLCNLQEMVFSFEGKGSDNIYLGDVPDNI